MAGGDDHKGGWGQWTRGRRLLSGDCGDLHFFDGQDLWLEFMGHVGLPSSGDRGVMRFSVFPLPLSGRRGPDRDKLPRPARRGGRCGGGGGGGGPGGGRGMSGTRVNRKGGLGRGHLRPFRPGSRLRGFQVGFGLRRGHRPGTSRKGF